MEDRVGRGRRREFRGDAISVTVPVCLYVCAVEFRVSSSSPSSSLSAACMNEYGSIDERPLRLQAVE